MTSFTLELLSDSPEHMDASRRRIMERAKEFRRRYCWDHSGAKHDPRVAGILRDLESARFWGALAAVDGQHPPYGLDDPYPARPLFHEDEIRQTAANVRTWARASFTEYDLQEILTVCINQALLRPKETAWPGTYRAHSILYRELVEKKDSLFAGVVDGQFRKRLNNGRFWEELGRNRAVAHEALTDHAADLDPSFAQRGYALLLAGKGVCLHGAPRLDLRPMSTATLDTYICFVVEIEKRKGIDVGMLVGAYAHAILSRHASGPRDDAEGDIDIDDDALRRRVTYLPLVARTLGSDAAARRDVLAALKIKENCYGQKAARSVMRLLPAQDAFAREYPPPSTGC